MVWHVISSAQSLANSLFQGVDRATVALYMIAVFFFGRRLLKLSSLANDFFNSDHFFGAAHDIQIFPTVTDQTKPTRKGPITIRQNKQLKTGRNG